jgi:hypothetical protein
MKLWIFTVQYCKASINDQHAENHQTEWFLFYSYSKLNFVIILVLVMNI